jgi:hypothetical protein
MASTYVNDLRLNEMATGDASGSWGTVTNTNLELIGEAFSYGTETIGDADSTLTIADGAADAARSFYLKITSSVDLTTTRIVTLAPNTVSKVWMIENATTGSQVITIKQGSGATINVPNGQVKMISTDGAGSGGAVLDLLVDVDLTGTTTLVNLDVSGAVDIAGDLTLSAGGDGALRFTAASSVKVLDNNAAALVFEEADNAYMTFVTTDGSEAVKFDKALDINAATQIDATVTVGVDDTGYDVKFFGATTGKSLLWDESADSLIVTGTTTLVGTTNLDAVDIDGATQIDATVTVGVDDTGYDVKFFGATAGAYMLWDESADDLILGGAAGLSVNSTALVTGVLTTTAATVSNGGGQFNGAINVGVDDTGYDVKFFGATTGKSLLWDESADSLTVAGNLSVDGGTIKLDGNYPVGTDNVALGDGAFDAVTSGIQNTAIGANSMTANTSGTNNSAVGRSSLGTNISGSELTAIGTNALFYNTGSYNTALGSSALFSNTTASESTAVGYQAGYSNTDKTGLDAFGYQAGYNANSSYCTFVGTNAGYGAAGGSATGEYNAAFGRSALFVYTSGERNAVVGVAALAANTSGSYNSAVGMYSLYANTTASYNTAVGYAALTANTTASYITGIGYQALKANTTGTANCAVAADALLANTTGTNNTAVGNNALTANTTASNNTAVGKDALVANTTGDSNVAVGTGALTTVDGGAGNNALGKEAGSAVTNGSNNLCLGSQAGDNITTGGANLMIGNYTQISSPTTNFATAIGYQVVGAAEYTTIGHAADDIRAQHGVATWATVSDERYKKDIVDSTTGLSFINALRPRTFKYRTLGELPETFRAYEANSTKVFKNSETNHGFIAQEIKAAIDADASIKDGFRLWDDREDGSQEVAEAALIPVLVKAIQELSAKNDALEARLAALES